MTYEEKAKTIEAWKVGSNPIDSWVNDMMDVQKIVNKNTNDGREYIVLINGQDKLVAEKGQYLIKSLNYIREPVYSVMDAPLFERLYQRTGVVK